VGAIEIVCEPLTKRDCTSMIPPLSASHSANDTAGQPGGEAESMGLAAYGSLRRDILSCRLMPGATVTEGELMATYGFGKNSCRIALTRLAHERLVRSRPRKGYQIAPITVKDVEEVFALRVQLEPMAARLAVNRVDTGLLRTLEAACRVEHTGPLPDRIDVFMDANKQFHLAIAEATGNERLLRTLSGLMDEMSRLVALGFNVQRVKPEIKHDHNAMIKAFEERDGKSAEMIARRHIETFQAQTLEKVYASLSQAGACLPLIAAKDST
jgi:DNA-binding GntR family transcriptional regulator